MADSKVPQAITDKFIAKVNESGYLPWQRPWELRENQNLTSHHIYTGCNRWMTALSSFASPYWLTFNKVRENGGHVNKGAEGTPIIFLKTVTKISENNLDDSSSYRFLRYYTVFNTEQTTLEIPFDTASKRALLDVETMFIKSRLPSIKHGDQRAFYAPDRDIIHLPYLADFKRPNEYYSTLFHELVHSTGHDKRLDRAGIRSVEGMKSESYSFEELVAEIGAALLCNLTGKYDEQIENNAVAYVRGWKSRLSNNTDWLISAASKAEKAVNYLLGKDN